MAMSTMMMMTMTTTTTTKNDDSKTSDSEHDSEDSDDSEDSEDSIEKGYKEHIEEFAEFTARIESMEKSLSRKSSPNECKDDEETIAIKNAIHSNGKDSYGNFSATPEQLFKMRRKAAVIRVRRMLEHDIPMNPLSRKDQREDKELTPKEKSNLMHNAKKYGRVSTEEDDDDNDGNDDNDVDDDVDIDVDDDVDNDDVDDVPKELKGFNGEGDYWIRNGKRKRN